MKTMNEMRWVDYAIYYPDEGEEGYDGIHDSCNIKELRKDTPPDIVKEYEDYLNDKTQEK